MLLSAFGSNVFFAMHVVIIISLMILNISL